MIFLAIFLAEKFVSSTLFSYIAPRNGWLTLLSMILLIVMAGAYRMIDRKLKDNPEQKARLDAHNLTSVAVLMVPLILGTLVPPRIFGAGDVPSRGIRTDLQLDSVHAGREWPDLALRRDILDLVHIMNRISDTASLDGQEAEVVGFVYHDARLTTDQFIVGRFAFLCCASDAQAIGVIVMVHDAQQYTQDTWVRVHGVFEQGEVDGQPSPILRANQIERVEQLEQPYLYP
jgi:uncharacterized repeat protein (TIGR03943 family)